MIPVASESTLYVRHALIFKESGCVGLLLAVITATAPQ